MRVLNRKGSVDFEIRRLTEDCTVVPPSTVERWCLAPGNQPLEKAKVFRELMREHGVALDGKQVQLLEHTLFKSIQENSGLSAHHRNNFHDNNNLGAFCYSREASNCIACVIGHDFIGLPTTQESNYHFDIKTFLQSARNIASGLWETLDYRLIAQNLRICEQHVVSNTVIINKE
ncbi:hypothetical protein MUCCIDRAFT_116172 [Mucor lusitanicus CBS 277.49]|uniref:Uncharacterized protein n=1 Tax=Mucor lusitanicus CBS 277.49 TaxID=747725 RepID=A0A162Y6W5_MUCCL|nr:hypothetical protein MUCCIDRAFT_116172 [Mucor lusitanicus CBS 277.49]